MIGRSIVHKNRPAISYIDNSKNVEKPSQASRLSKESPLHLRTHNVGLITDGISTANDLRNVQVRAKELADSITSDEKQPEVIVFQETFNEDATRELAEGIKKDYPYIIHNVAPHLSGFNSGCMIASKYPMENVEFYKFDGMIDGDRNLAPRGITKVELNLDGKKVQIFGAHTQSFLGEERVNVRLEQMTYLRDIMRREKEISPNVHQIAVGDLNTAAVTAWAEDNYLEHPEKKVQDYIFTRFNDLFLKDHFAYSGQRSSGQPHFLASDNKAMRVQGLEEPSGSWYQGPYEEKPFLVKQAVKNESEFLQLRDQEKSSWGKPAWYQKQEANTCRFDYILTPNDSELDGKAEIRRIRVPFGSQSASSCRCSYSSTRKSG